MRKLLLAFAILLFVNIGYAEDFVGGIHNQLRYYFDLQNGTIYPVTIGTFGVNGGIPSIDKIDFDGDGKDEIAFIAQSFDGSNYYADLYVIKPTNVGCNDSWCTAQYQQLFNMRLPSYYCEHLQTFDYDGDQYEDLAVGCYQGKVYIYRNNNGASLTEIGNISLPGTLYPKFGIADFDNDDQNEIIYINPSVNPPAIYTYDVDWNSFLLANKICEITIPYRGTSGGGGDFAISDYGKDGLLDTYFVYVDRYLYYIKSNGTCPSIVYEVDNGPLYYGIGNGDYDNDGYIDIVTAQYDNAYIVYINNGTGLVEKYLIGPSASGGYYDYVVGNFRTFTAFDFLVDVEKDYYGVMQSSNAVANVNINLISGTAQAVTLSVSGLPSNTDYSIIPSVVTPPSSSTLTISTTDDTPTGNYTVQVCGNSDSITRCDSFTLEVKEAPALMKLLNSGTFIFIIVMGSVGALVSRASPYIGYSLMVLSLVMLAIKYPTVMAIMILSIAMLIVYAIARLIFR